MSRDGEIPSRPSPRVGRQLLGIAVWFHRWSGVILCLLFAMWFASGAVMLFVPFPSLGAAEKAQSAAVVDVTKVRAGATEVLSEYPDARGLRLVDIAGTPHWIVRPASGADVAVSAETGKARALLTADEAGAIALRFSGAQRVREVPGAIAYDQWIVPNGYDSARPFFRVRLDDPARTDLYVSARTGEVLQRTTNFARGVNWTGAVLHWIYLTPLRKDWGAWDLTVWWISLIATASALAGAALGVFRWLAPKARPGVSPFVGWMRWHHIGGLAVGLFVLAWIISGWLSMDHGRLFSRGEADGATRGLFAGRSLEDAAGAATPGTLAALGPASQIWVRSVGGEAVLTAVGGAGRAARVVVPREGGSAREAVPTEVLRRALETAWPGASFGPFESVSDTDVFLQAEGMPSGVLRAKALSRPAFDVYVDPVQGEIIKVMNDSRKAYAWVYYVMHTFKVPGLIERPALRRGIMLVLLLAGFAFSVTGIVVALRRLRRTLGASQ